MPTQLAFRSANPDGTFAPNEEVDERNPLPVVLMGTDGNRLPDGNDLRQFFDAFANSVGIIAKPSAGYLRSIIAYNINGAVRYLQFHNSGAVPAASAVPVSSLPIPAGTANTPGSVVLDYDFFGPRGRYFGNGISIGISTTSGTYTAATVTDHWVSGSFV